MSFVSGYEMKAHITSGDFTLSTFESSNGSK